MWVVNNSVKPKLDNWPILEVDCFTKPHALIIESIYPGIYDTYLYYVALAKSYGFSHSLTQIENWAFGLYPYILEKLGFEYCVHHCETVDDLKKTIKQNIDNGVSLLVPGNARSLYYTWAYKKVDAFHLFLVKGYEEKLGLYSILDNFQNMSGPIPVFQNISGVFTDFIIQENILEEAWLNLKDLNYSYYNKTVISIKQTKKDFKIPTALEKLEFFTGFLDLERPPIRYRELSSFQVVLDYFERTKEPVDGRERHFLLEIVFYNKKAVFQMILKLLADMSSQIEIFELSELSIKIFQDWEKLLKVFYFHLMRGSIKKVEDLEHAYRPILDDEDKFLKGVKSLLLQSQ